MDRTLAGSIDVARDVMADCILPVPGQVIASLANPRAAPGYPEINDTWQTAPCRSGEVLTGVDLWLGDADASDTALGGVTLRCRAVRR